MVQEGVWAAFDGAPVQNLPWNRAQPNGGRKQNCVVINAEPPGFTDGEVFRLQDKDCSEAFDGFLCYKDGKQFMICLLLSLLLWSVLNHILMDFLIVSINVCDVRFSSRTPVNKIFRTKNQ